MLCLHQHGAAALSPALNELLGGRNLLSSLSFCLCRSVSLSEQVGPCFASFLSVRFICHHALRERITSSVRLRQPCVVRNKPDTAHLQKEEEEEEKKDGEEIIINRKPKKSIKQKGSNCLRSVSCFSLYLLSLAICFFPDDLLSYSIYHSYLPPFLYLPCFSSFHCIYIHTFFLSFFLILFFIFHPIFLPSLLPSVC